MAAGVCRGDGTTGAGRAWDTTGDRDSDGDKRDRSASSTGSREHPWDVDRETVCRGWRKAKDADGRRRRRKERMKATNESKREKKKKIHQGDGMDYVEFFSLTNGQRAILIVSWLFLSFFLLRACAAETLLLARRLTFNGGGYVVATVKQTATTTTTSYYRR